MAESLQDRFGPETICFGCGPANRDGLQIKSYPEGTEVIAEFLPSSHHRAFPGAINGGVIGTLLDCHMNWTAAWHFMQQREDDRPPVTVTSEFSVRLRLVTPPDTPLHLTAHVVGSVEGRADVEATVEAAGDVTALGTGTFVAVEEGHPAFHRW